MNEHCIQLLLPRSGWTTAPRALGTCCGQKPLQTCLMLQARHQRPSFPPQPHPRTQGGSCYFYLRDLSWPPKERAFSPPSSNDCNSRPGWRSRLQYKEGAEPVFWSLLGTMLSCFYSSHRPYILPGDWGGAQANSRPPTSPAPGGWLSWFAVLRASLSGAGTSIWPPLKEDGF